MTPFIITNEYQTGLLESQNTDEKPKLYFYFLLKTLIDSSHILYIFFDFSMAV